MKLQAELDEITRLRDMFETAFAKAVERTKALQSENYSVNSDKTLETETNKEYNGNKSYSLYWHTDLTRTQLKEVEKRISQVVNHDEKRITDTASWYSGRLNGDNLFVIYSTEDLSNPTILYEVKGKNAKLEQNILTRALEVIGNERSAVEKQRIVNELLSGNWVPKTHNLAHNDDRLGNGGSNIGNASVLQGQSSQFIGSGAFRNVIENLFKKQAERLKNSKSHSLKEKDAQYLELAKDPVKNAMQLELMVNDAAIEAGLKYTGLHGTDNFGHTEFKHNKATNAKAFFFTNKFQVAQSYSGVKGVTRINSGEKHGNYAVALDIKNPLIVECNGSFWNNLPFNIGKDGSGKNGKVITDDVVQYAKKHRYDGVIFKDVVDAGKHVTYADEVEFKTDPEARKKWASTVYAVFKSNQIKSLDPVTYDNKGNVIPLSERFNFGKKDIRYSLKDSDGKTLSAEQQEYFKDSKVRDENGNLLVVYHGTRNGGFTVFNRNHNYYTDSRDMADSYAPNGVLYKGYLNITKPYTIDANGAKWSAIPISEEVKKMLDSAGSSTFKERGKWCASVADIVAAVSDLVDEGEADYDGVIVHNVDDTGSYYKGSEKNIGNVYISFSSEQFKDIDNKNPTSNPDIRYSLKYSKDVAGKTQKSTDTNGGANFSLKTIAGNNIVWIEESGLTNKQLNNHQAVAEYIKQHIGEVYTIIESGQKVYIGEDLPQEYTQSKYTTYLRNVNKTAARGKNKAIDGFGELIETATNRRWEKTRHTENKDAKYGMYRYNNSFAFPVRDNKGNVTNVRAFDVELLIRNASDGNKYLYDIVGIEENTTTEIGLLERMTRLPDRSQATRDSVSNNKISQEPGFVKKNLSLKGINHVTKKEWSGFVDAFEDVQNGKKGASERLAKYVDSGMISTEVYTELVKTYGAIPAGENPSREITVPKKTASDKKVSQTVRTILEAKAFRSVIQILLKYNTEEATGGHRF